MTEDETRRIRAYPPGAVPIVAPPDGQTAVPAVQAGADVEACIPVAVLDGPFDGAPPPSAAPRETQTGPTRDVAAPASAPSASPEDFTLRVAQTKDRPDALIGCIVGGDFQIARLLGEGGMGRVYVAQHRVLHKKRAAVKVLLPELVRRGDEFTKRFLREGQAATRIEHDNVIRVFDSGQLPDGSPYLLMDFVENAVELGEYVKSRPRRPGQGLAPSEWLPLMVQICAAVAAAHEAGVIHRDLKPNNILILRPEGRPRTTYRRGRGGPQVIVLDFGIARVQDLRGGTTRGGIGTVGYMPPEQAKGQAITVTADIYAIGVILFELVTGAEPFPGVTVFDVVMKQLEGPPDPRQWAPELPQGLAAAIRLCLDPVPEKRPASITALLGLIVAELPEARDVVTRLAPELGDSLAPEVVAAPRPRRRRRWPWLLGAAGTAAAGAAALIIVINPDAPAAMGMHPDARIPVMAAADARIPVMAAADARLPAMAAAEAPTPAAETVAVAVEPHAAAPSLFPSATPPPTTPPPTTPPPATPPPATPPAAPAGTAAAPGEPGTAPASSSPPAAARVSGTGFLTVYADPYADVYLRGELIGTATFTRVRVPAGTLALVLSHPDHGRKKKRVTVTPGRETQIHWTWDVAAAKER